MAIKKATIVLEGGATRGIFTSGDRGIGRSVQCTGLCIQAAGEDKRLYDSR